MIPKDDYLDLLSKNLSHLVLGRPGASWIKSGAAKGAICSLIMVVSCLVRAGVNTAPSTSVTKQYNASP
jgi:hypothetical protein